jgi:hypothetical protein
MSLRERLEPRQLRANRWGCFALIAVIAALIAAIVYIGLNSPTENTSNAVIPVAQ